MTDNDLKRIYGNLAIAQTLERDLGDKASEIKKAFDVGLPRSLSEEFSQKFNPIIPRELDEARHQMAMIVSANSRELDEARHQMAMIVSANSRELDEIRHQLAMAAPANIPGLDELRRMNAVLKNVLVEHRKQFYVPDPSEITSLTPNLEKELTRFAMRDSTASYKDGLDRAMKSLSAPWLKIDDKIKSITAVSKLYDMGHLLNTKAMFSDELLKNLRENLGDWRGKFDLPQVILNDPLARHDFYVERGFNPSLTDFPSDAFEQAVSVTGIKTKQQPLIRAYSLMPQLGKVNVNSGIKRTTKAYILLRNFESQVRNFIDSHMKPIFGENWPKHRTTGEIYKKWRDRRDEAQNNGEKAYPLIAYADFADYEVIVTRKDNWEKIFKSYFKDKIFIQVSFRRLYPIRNCTMHSRPITHDDELILHVETKHLLKAIGSMV